MGSLILSDKIEERIFTIRDQRVMIDRDLAELYGVETKYLNRQVRRNIERFPHNFMFQINKEERNELVTICHRFEKMKHSASLPLAFTEHGVAMLASVLKSRKAVAISIHIIQVFVKLRRMIFSHKVFKEKLDLLERKVVQHDRQINKIIESLRQMITPTSSPRKKIGF